MQFKKNENLPDWRVIEKEMHEIETYKLSTITKSASHYSVQLDHRTDNKKRIVLGILLSSVDKNWDQFSQVDIKRLSRSTAQITAEEVNLTITSLGLGAKHSIAYQADNCSALGRSPFEMSVAKSFIHSLSDQVEEISSQEVVIDTAFHQNVAAENSIDKKFESTHFVESMHIVNAELRRLGENIEFCLLLSMSRERHTIF